MCFLIFNIIEKELTVFLVRWLSRHVFEVTRVMSSPCWCYEKAIKQQLIQKNFGML